MMPGDYIPGMRIPSEVPVMTLPGATLFPQALLPLYIFEPRYRRMLKDMLASERMFTVAMQRPGTTHESPCAVAGLGLIRVSVDHKDGTSHLILQGLTRVHLKQTLQYKPYRVQTIRPVEMPEADSVVVDALLAKLLELVRHRLQLGQPAMPFPLLQSEASESAGGSMSSPADNVTGDQVVEYLESQGNPGAVADMVACALLGHPGQRQTILETFDVEERLKHLVHFLMAEIESLQNNPGPYE